MRGTEKDKSATVDADIHNIFKEEGNSRICTHWSALPTYFILLKKQADFVTCFLFWRWYDMIFFPVRIILHKKKKLILLSI